LRQCNIVAEIFEVDADKKTATSQKYSANYCTLFGKHTF